MYSYGKGRPPELLQGLLKQLRERGEPGGLAADDGEREPEPEPGGADHRLRVSANADPHRERAGLGVRHYVLVVQGRAGGALPGDRSALEQLGEQRRLLLEQFFVVGEVVSEQREGLDPRPRMTSARPPEIAFSVE